MQKIKPTLIFLLFIFFLFSFCHAQQPDNKREKMIIVAYFSFVSQMYHYMDAKETDNIDCQLIMVDSTDNFLSIKTKIDNLYKDFSADFLLLVGDNEHIPAYKIVEGLSDIHYAFEEENNPYPRMSVGRFSVETAADLQTMMDRTLVRQSFTKHAIGIASHKESDLTNKKDYEQVHFMGQQLQSKGFTTVSELFDGSSNGNPSYHDVVAALQTGANWLNYAGYGSYDGWNTTEFESQHIDSLFDNVELPIVLSASCLGGHFANRTCFAEKWLRSTKNANPIGAVAVIMSSSLTDWDATLSAMLVMSENMPAVNSNCRLGNLYLQGYLHILDSMQRPQDAQCWLLFGDPSLWVYPSEQTAIFQKATNNQIITVYPNPTTGQIIINNEQLTIKNIEICNVVGRIYLSITTKDIPLPPFKGGTASATNSAPANSPFEGGRGMSEITIDISPLQAGMYFLKIDNTVFKIIKQ